MAKFRNDGSCGSSLKITDARAAPSAAAIGSSVYYTVGSAPTKLSIIIPCFNARSTIERAIESVVCQDSFVHELIIQDGASSDGTREILRKYGPPVRFVSEPDQGQSDALNRALKRVTGDAVGWLNADDVYCPGAFRLAAEAFDRHPEVDFVYGDFALVDAVGRRIRHYHVSEWNWTRLFSHGLYLFSGATFIRREVFNRVGGFNIDLHYAMDLEFFLRLGPSAKGLHVPELLGTFTAWENSKTGSAPLKSFCEGLGVYRRHLPHSAKLRAAVLFLLASRLAYIYTRALWRSPVWSRLRPVKRL